MQLTANKLTVSLRLPATTIAGILNVSDQNGTSLVEVKAGAGKVRQLVIDTADLLVLSLNDTPAKSVATIRNLSQDVVFPDASVSVEDDVFVVTDKAGADHVYSKAFASFSVENRVTGEAEGEDAPEAAAAPAKKPAAKAAAAAPKKPAGRGRTAAKAAADEQEIVEAEVVEEAPAAAPKGRGRGAAAKAAPAAAAKPAGRGRGAAAAKEAPAAAPKRGRGAAAPAAEAAGGDWE